MFGSQALETAIGLVLMFFVVSLAASAFVETLSRLLGKRSKDLEKVIGAILSGPGAKRFQTREALGWFKGTSVYHGLQVGSGKSIVRRSKRPSYISAKAFADAVIELERTLPDTEILPGGLQKRLESIRAEVGEELLDTKAELESWFDGVMARLEGSYKRWVSSFLFGAGLIIAVTANASAYDTAVSLWNDSATRTAVVEAAGRATAEEGSPDIASVAAAIEEMEAMHLPIGWDEATRQSWSGTSARPWNWTNAHLATFLGWLTTAVLVLLGAPFWFDLLTKLVSLRSSGTKPTLAAGDDASATSIRAANARARRPGPPRARRAGPPKADAAPADNPADDHAAGGDDVTNDDAAGGDDATDDDDAAGGDDPAGGDATGDDDPADEGQEDGR